MLHQETVDTRRKLYWWSVETTFCCQNTMGLSTVVSEHLIFSTQTVLHNTIVVVVDMYINVCTVF